MDNTRQLQLLEDVKLLIESYILETGDNELAVLVATKEDCLHMCTMEDEDSLLHMAKNVVIMLSLKGITLETLKHPTEDLCSN